MTIIALIFLFLFGHKYFEIHIDKNKEGDTFIHYTPRKGIRKCIVIKSRNANN